MTNKPKITVSLDEFDEKIVKALVGFEGQNKSEVIRVILKKWIGRNSDLIQNQYGINFRDIRREIQLEEEEMNLEDLVKDISKFFKRAESIEIDRLADKMSMSSKSLLNFIEEYGDDLEEKGINLKIKGSLIVKV